MPKIIVTSRYIKSSESSHKAFYVKYIGTREGTIFDTSHNSIPTPGDAEKVANTPPTEKQKELIGEVLKEFKDAKEMFEYADYTANPTVATASSFLTAVFDRNADIVLGKTAYVHYLAERPGAVLASGTQHGLFTSDSGEYINIDALAVEVAHHKGNVWTHVVSLRREDARNVGYAFDNPQITAEAWRGLVRNHIQKIAENTKIAPENLKWYAAFHNKETNPHVHIMVYSKDPKEGFLTNRGIENIRSSFANDIYSAELAMLNEKQTDLRNRLKAESAETFRTIKSKWLSGRYEDGDELISSIGKLRSQLADYKGRKVYKYMKPEVKDTIDDIARILYRNEDIQKLYSLWCECQSDRISIYTSAKTEFPKLEDNTEFKSIKNMILREVFESLDPNYDLPEAPFILEEPPDEVDYRDIDELYSANDAEKELNRRNDDENRRKYMPLKTAYEILKAGLDEEDVETAISAFRNADEKGNRFATYQLAKIYLREDTEYFNVDEAVRLLEKSIELDNDNAMCKLGIMYLYGKHVDKDIERGMELLKAAEERGNEFAKQVIESYGQHDYSYNVLAGLNLFASFTRMFNDNHRGDTHKFIKHISAVDKLDMTKTYEKKIAQGQKIGM